MKAWMILVWCSCVVVHATGCASSGGPYDTNATARRSPMRAEQLTKAGVAAMEQGDTRGAEMLFREALGFDLYHGPAHNNLGVLFLDRGELYEAANEFEWARKLMPGNPDPRLNLGLTLERAGRIDEAIEQYKTAIEVTPGHLPSIKAMVRTQLRYDREDDRTSRYLSDIRLRSSDPSWTSWATEQEAMISDRTE